MGPALGMDGSVELGRESGWGCRAGWGSVACTVGKSGCGHDEFRIGSRQILSIKLSKMLRLSRYLVCQAHASPGCPENVCFQ